MNRQNGRGGRFRLPELVGVVLVVISGTFTGLSSGGFVIDFNHVGFTVLSTLELGVHTVSSGVVGVFTAVRQLGALRRENAELTEKLRNYESMLRANAEIRKENERLKEQLDFSDTIAQRSIAARIIARDPNMLYSSITIDKGIRNGIRKNMPVIATQNGNEGLVGKVVSVGYTTSIVMPIYDTRCNVSSRIQNTRDIGLVSGLNTSSNLLTMRYIKKRVAPELHYGDVVVTSGENGNYMRDIPVGTIYEVTELDYDSSLRIVLAPIIDFSRLETVVAVDRFEYKDSEM